MAAIKTNAVFASTLKDIKTNTTKMRNDVQACLVYAFAQYKNHGNTTFLNRIRATASTAKAIPCEAIEDYVQHYANVTYKDKKFTSKNTKDRRVKSLDSKWFDSINVDETPVAPKPTDILKMVMGTLKQVQNKHEKELLNDNEKMYELAEVMLAQFISAMEDRGFEVSK